MITLSVCIMTASYDEKRRKDVEILIRRLKPESIAKYCKDFQIVSDWWESGAWFTARESWKRGMSMGASHHLVLQEDIDVCNDFLAVCHKIIRSKSDSILGLYSNRKICEEAQKKNIRWVEIPDGTWGQAILMPTYKIEKFLFWEKQNIKKEFKNFDDTRVALWACDTNEKVLCPQPSLVNHTSPSESLLGNNHPKRIARWFEKEDMLNKNWESEEIIVGKRALSKCSEMFYSQ